MKGEINTKYEYEINDKEFEQFGHFDNNENEDCT